MPAPTARMPLDPPRTVLNRFAGWWSRRTYGAALDPVTVIGHHPGVLLTYARHERSLARWNRLDPTLKALAVMAAAGTVGCSWCLDFGHWESTARGVDPAKLREVRRWRDSAVFTETERRVLEYAEAASSTPPTVTDEQVAGLRAELDDAALVELTMMIAVENSRSRFNAALGLTSQGFGDRCQVLGG